MIIILFMKRIFPYLLFICLFAVTVGVGYAQDEQSCKSSVVVTENHPLSADFIITALKTQEQNQIKPKSEVIAFAEAITGIGVKPNGIATADYGDCVEESFIIMNYRLTEIIQEPVNKYLAIKPITHSSGGMPFRWC